MTRCRREADSNFQSHREGDGDGLLAGGGFGGRTLLGLLGGDGLLAGGGFGGRALLGLLGRGGLLSGGGFGRRALLRCMVRRR